MADVDDDAPPPLSSLAEQVDALKLRSQVGSSTSGRSPDVPSEESLRVANVVITTATSTSGAGKQSSSSAAAPAFKKGFFDAAPKRRAKPPAERKPAEPPAEEIPMIRAKSGANAGPSIPDFLRLEPDEQAKRYMAAKNDLLEKLKPTPDMVTQIGKDPALLAAFDDPEVMAAVNDIAANPQNHAKYMNKPKVVAFYAAMGKLMGEKLDKAEQAAGKQQGPRSSQGLALM